MSDILCVKGSVFLRKIVPKFYQKLFSKPSKILGVPLRRRGKGKTVHKVGTILGEF